MTSAPLIRRLYAKILFVVTSAPLIRRLLFSEIKIWKLSEVMRHGISRLPYGLRYFVSQIIAGLVYVPFAKTAYILEKLGLGVSNIPLSAYRHLTFYSMRTDALDRFGTRLEQRFTKSQIKKMMEAAGLCDIVFSNEVPYWCAVGMRKTITSSDS